ncbi:Cof subfamily protein (haloacid dehalogenase superfamily) [Streptococcus loxodontisalivarius]|uniref:Cof subfamily protein (Haloacid dehalogenase superfamily) n=1 Tax=Streptococcus loxodontisalivarius TaxID=1349415 RepID=A0ABS2PV28_9STRE|nr:HAD family hydrolase [Streptococcus loxodontisalivarius]MBM7643309.1 Cof subfamily protein (haloacid dehalogenase superfamily) [Streptococcus loxodontisalivarius]
MFPIAISLELGDNPIACYNGALIIKGDSEGFQTLIQHGMLVSDLKAIYNFIRREFPQISLNLYSNASWMVENIDQWGEIEAAITHEVPDLVDFRELIEDPDFVTHKLLLIADAQNIKFCLEELDNLPLEDVSFYLSKDNYLEMTSKSVSKENALLEITKHYQLDLTETMAIGDNFNDIPMLEKAGIGVAMGNAPQEVKEAADYVTDDNDNHGISKALDDYVLI